MNSFLYIMYIIRIIYVEIFYIRCLLWLVYFFFVKKIIEISLKVNLVIL